MTSAIRLAAAAWARKPKRSREHAILTLALYEQMSARMAASLTTAFWQRFHRNEAAALRAAIALLRAAEKPAGKRFTRSRKGRT